MFPPAEHLPLQECGRSGDFVEVAANRWLRPGESGILAHFAYWETAKWADIAREARIGAEIGAPERAQSGPVQARRLIKGNA